MTTGGGAGPGRAPMPAAAAPCPCRPALGSRGCAAPGPIAPLPTSSLALIGRRPGPAVALWQAGPCCAGRGATAPRCRTPFFPFSLSPSLTQQHGGHRAEQQPVFPQEARAAASLPARFRHSSGGAWSAPSRGAMPARSLARSPASVRSAPLRAFRGAAQPGRSPGNEKARPFTRPEPSQLLCPPLAEPPRPAVPPVLPPRLASPSWRSGVRGGLGSPL